MNWTRRELLKAALVLPAGSYLARYEAVAAPLKGKVKITNIKTMQLRHNGGDCLIKIETDAGLVGYGEAGGTGAIVRSRLQNMQRMLIGQDPLEIERHFHNMSTLTHTYIAHIPTVSGVDIALWDLAGKILGQPVYKLLGGPFRDTIPLYTDDQPTDFFDRAIVRDFAQKNKSHPYRWTIVKVMFHHAAVLDPERRGRNALSAARYTMLTSSEIKRIGKAFMNLREAFGDDMGLVVHCLNEYDLPSAVGIAKATAPIDPVWIEDPMTPYYSDSWKALRQQSPIKILTGEKLEMPKQFLPFLQNEVLDIVQPDLAYAGGFTGCKKIADLASLYQVPMNLHNYGTAVLHMASLHFAASIFDFYVCESFVGKPKMEDQMVEPLCASKFPQVKDAHSELPEGLGLGIELNEDAIKADLAPGETWWG
jgi:L-alanine-DL-glutamate epimerase-like enolase superfamily enzyme